MRPIFNDLRKQLESLSQLQSLSNESKIVSEKDIIQDFVKKCSASRINVDDMKTVLAKVYKEDVLISGDIFEWAMEKVITSHGSESHDISRTTPITTDEEIPLICQDMIYHASLCNLAVCTRNSATYNKFFESDYPLHTIEAASISIPKDNIDRYLIARQGSVYYVAFKSESLLSEWSKHFRSFNEGTVVMIFMIIYHPHPYYVVYHFQVSVFRVRKFHSAFLFV